MNPSSGLKAPGASISRSHSPRCESACLGNSPARPCHSRASSASATRLTSTPPCGSIDRTLSGSNVFDMRLVTPFRTRTDQGTHTAYTSRVTIPNHHASNPVPDDRHARLLPSTRDQVGDRRLFQDLLGNLSHLAPRRVQCTQRRRQIGRGEIVIESPRAVDSGQNLRQRERCRGAYQLVPSRRATRAHDITGRLELL